MKITELKTMYVKPRWLFLEICTDEGIVGWGEPVLEGQASAVAAVLKQYEKYLIGKDPLRIEDTWQALYRGGFYRGGPILCSALSGVEQALWDIKGKYYGAPVYDMLGGRCRDRIRMYTHIKAPAIAGGPSIEEMTEVARQRVCAGYTALKYSIIPPILPIESPAHIREHVARFAAVRETIGDQVDLAIDFHGRVSPMLARRLIAELEPYSPMFIEEPVLPENVDLMADIAHSTSIPIAAGERLFTKWSYREYFEKRAIAIAQPDLCHVGGIAEARKIAAMSEVYFGVVAPHNPLGPISLAACLQLDACIPNFLAQEHLGMPDGADVGVGYLKEPFHVENGYIAVTNKPGLGIEIDEEALADKICRGEWETPRLRHEDGSVADW